MKFKWVRESSKTKAWHWQWGSHGNDNIITVTTTKEVWLWRGRWTGQQQEEVDWKEDSPPWRQELRAVEWWCEDRRADWKHDLGKQTVWGPSQGKGANILPLKGLPLNKSKDISSVVAAEEAGREGHTALTFLGRDSRKLDIYLQFSL